MEEAKGVEGGELVEPSLGGTLFVDDGPIVDGLRWHEDKKKNEVFWIIFC